MGRKNCPELYGTDRAITPLAAIDEEDLIFSNYTCFVRPSQFFYQNSTIQLGIKDKEDLDDEKLRNLDSSSSVLTEFKRAAKVILGDIRDGITKQIRKSERIKF
jgi:hypothetical protein